MLERTHLSWIYACILFMGCTGDDDASVPLRAGNGAPSCASLRPCSIDDTSCQQRVLALTACERSSTAPALPALRMITAAEFGAELRAEAMDEEDSGSEWDAALIALHLLEGGTTSTEASIEEATRQVAAYYDPRDRRLTLIRDAQVAQDDATLPMYLLSHELTHYLQDVEYDLATFQRAQGTTTDALLAVKNLIEGEATVTSTRVLARLNGVSPAQLDWTRFFDSIEQSSLQSLAQSPLVAAATSLPYSVGGRYVAGAWQGSGMLGAGFNPGRDHVDALFVDPPLSVTDWLAGYRGDDIESLAEPLDCGPPMAPQGFTLRSLDSLGAIGAVALLAAAKLPSLELAGMLRGDHIALYGNSGSGVLVTWRLRFASANASQVFAQRIASLGLIVRVFDRELLISAASAGESALTGDALAACPTLEESAGAVPPLEPIAARRLARQPRHLLPRASAEVGLPAL